MPCDTGADGTNGNQMPGATDGGELSADNGNFGNGPCTKNEDCTKPQICNPHGVCEIGIFLMDYTLNITSKEIVFIDTVSLSH